MGVISSIYSSPTVLVDAERHREDQKRRAAKEQKRRGKIEATRIRSGKKANTRSKRIAEKDSFGRPVYQPGMGKEFYKTAAWIQARYRVMQARGARCECCGRTKVDDVKLHVDHIKPRSKFPALELVENNMQILCQECNEGKGAWDQTDWRVSGGITHPSRNGIKAADG